MVIREIEFGAPPEEIFAGLAERAGSFFLDSARPAGGLGAYSFIGFDPFLVFRATGSEIELNWGESREMVAGDPFLELRKLLRRFASPSAPGLPFSGGAVGYFSYELCRQLEPVAGPAPDAMVVPDAEFGFYDGVFAFETATGRAFAVAHPVHRRDADTILSALEQAARAAPAQVRAHAPEPNRVLSAPPQSNFSPAGYLQAIARIKAYIASGDVYQVNLTQRYSTPFSGGAYALYRRLRERSPAAFSCYLNGTDFQVVSSSPERFFRLRGDRAETRPIKGTRPRGADPATDARIRAELLTSPKDRAELLMIVDLERNDLGRVCEPGSIVVEDLFQLESHPTVHHLVANVSGRLRPGWDAIDCIRALFPGGSITGAPKVRAMQIIGELEPCRRGIYTGAIGYLGFDGDCDLSIAIRTIVCRGQRATYGVGGGIVWDSDPQNEYEETLHKGRAMRAALCGD